MKQFPKVFVPFTESEWNYVQKNLLSTDVESLEQVLEFLCLWESRTGSQTPVFIQMSKLVIQAILYDLKNCSDAADRSNELDAVSIYGLSLTRFINYVNNIAQPKSGNLLSIVNALKPVGIPERVVHLRQDVVHGEMPSIDELRDAVYFCRDWLWEMHWRYSMAIAVCNPVNSTTSSVSNAKSIPDLKQLFLQLWKYNSKKTNNAKEREAIDVKSKVILNTIEQLVGDNLQDVLGSFSNALVLSEDKMKSAKAYLQIANFETDKHGWEISLQLSNVWLPIFEMFSRNGRYGALISHLSTVVCDELVSIDHRHQIVAWIRCIINKTSVRGPSLSISDLNTIAYNVVCAESFFQVEDFNRVMNLFGDNRERKVYYQRIWKLKRPSSSDTSEANDENMTQTQPILTLGSLKSALEKRKGLRRNEQQDMSESVNWQLNRLKTPLGLTDDQTGETLNLRI